MFILDVDLEEKLRVNSDFKRMVEEERRRGLQLNGHTTVCVEISMDVTFLEYSLTK